MIDNSSQPLDVHDELTYQRVTTGTEPQGDGKPAYVKTFPVKVTMDLLRRGRERYTINCCRLPRAGRLRRRHWWPSAPPKSRRPKATPPAGSTPKDFHTDDMRAQPVGQIYNTITNGARTMPAYAKQTSVLDRWAIVAYVKALQRSQDAKPEDVPEAEKEKYK